MTGVVNVPYSKKYRVRHRVEKILEVVPGPSDQCLRVQEHPGPSLRVSMIRNDPFPREKCDRPGCPLGRDGNCNNKCYNESVGYTVVCRRCLESNTPPRIYIGETSRSVYTRIQGHLSDLRTSARNNRGNSWMYNRIQESHSGEYNQEDPGADWKVTLKDTFRKPLERQISEFIGIRKAKTLGQGRVGSKEMKISTDVFNTKEEWYSHTSQ